MKIILNTGIISNHQSVTIIWPNQTKDWSIVYLCLILIFRMFLVSLEWLEQLRRNLRSRDTNSIPPLPRISRTSVFPRRGKLPRSMQPKKVCFITLSHKAGDKKLRRAIFRKLKRTRFMLQCIGRNISIEEQS